MLKTESSQEDDQEQGPELLDVVPMTEAFARMMTSERNAPMQSAAISSPYEWRPMLSRPEVREAVQQEIGAASSAHAPHPVMRKRGAETTVDQPTAASSSSTAADEQPVMKTPRGTRSSQ